MAFMALGAENTRLVFPGKHFSNGLGETCFAGLELSRLDSASSLVSRCEEEQESRPDRCASSFPREFGRARRDPAPDAAIRRLGRLQIFLLSRGRG